MSELSADPPAADMEDSEFIAACKLVREGIDIVEAGSSACRRALQRTQEQLASERRLTAEQLRADRAQLRAESEHAEELIRKVRASREVAGARVVLNVGGQRFETTEQTLSAAPSFLSALLSFGGSADDTGEELFVDRNPKHFPVVLDYLRTGLFIEEGLSRRELAEIRQEADYYQLQGLLDALGMLPPFRWDVQRAAEGCVSGDGLRYSSDVRGRWTTVVADTARFLGSTLQWSVEFVSGPRVIVGVVDHTYREGDISPYWAYENDGAVYYNCDTEYVTKVGYKPGDVVTVAVDTGRRTVAFSLNGELVFSTRTGNGPAVAIPAISLKGGSQVSLVATRARRPPSPDSWPPSPRHTLGS
eukprot:TRINITY_DN10255_c0_g1_i1.p1 TRINITY_DN10255_c0_g1~~TRINITY_DN10255_c0_g1_i1.p1  ORF type:complete len:380 (+),score=107.77 TRINITY_DN10255_c0_g1_i1:61-1140(+)